MREESKNYILKEFMAEETGVGGDRAGADPGYPYRIGHCIQETDQYAA